MSAPTEDEDRPDADLEARADLSRARVLDAIEVLDHRRHEALDLRHRVDEVRREVRGHVRTVALACGAATLAGIGFVAHRIATRGSRQRRERVHMLQRLWAHPERVGKRHEPQPSLASSIVRTLILAFVTRAIRQHFSPAAPAR